MNFEAPTDRPGVGSVEAPGEPLVDAEAGSMPLPRSESGSPAGSRLLLGVSLVLIALNLRFVFSSLSAVLPEVMRATGMTSSTASVVTTLPVLCMGVFAPLATRSAARFGAERTILGVLVVLLAGTALRGFGTVPSLFAGALLAGAGIAVGNVLLPGLIKRDFPDRIALMTGLFTMALCASAALAAGFTVPLERLMGGAWTLALAAWALPALAAALLWAPQAAGAPHQPLAGRDAAPSLWRNRLAWQVTLFMGLQSALAYCVFGYLAPILRERGMDPATAGLVVSCSVVWQCLACLVVPAAAVRLPDQRFINIAFFVLALAGLLGCIFASLGGVWLWASCSGLGQGGLITLAITAIVLRAGDARMAARLSGMSQSVGYTLASGGPLLFGILHGSTRSYAAPAIMLALVSLVGMWTGYEAGRNQQITA